MTRRNIWPRLVRNTVIGLLLAVVVLYLVSGFGITEFRIMETITFGLLTKNVAFKIHNNLWIPFLVLLLLHICLPFYYRWRQAKTARR